MTAHFYADLILAGPKMSFEEKRAKLTVERDRLQKIANSGPDVLGSGEAADLVAIERALTQL